MSDQTQAALSTRGERTADLTMRARDRQVLRWLAASVAELAARPIEREKRDLWYRHNALEPTRPLIFCDPENGWNEIIPPHQLACEGELARTRALWTPQTLWRMKRSAWIQRSRRSGR